MKKKLAFGALGMMVVAAFAAHWLGVIDFGDKARAEKEFGHPIYVLRYTPPNLEHRAHYMVADDKSDVEVSFTDKSGDTSNGRALSIGMRHGQQGELDTSKYKYGSDTIINGHRAHFVPNGDKNQKFNNVSWFQDGYSFIVAGHNINDDELLKAAKSLKKT